MDMLILWYVVHLLITIEGTLWSRNAVYNVTQTAVHSSNISDCFVCVSGPAHLQQGFPLEADPLHPGAWLTKEGATLETDRPGTLTPYEIIVTRTAALCYESEHGTTALGRYPQCTVTAVIKRMGSQKGKLLSQYTADPCHGDVNVTLWQRIPVHPELWVSSYGMLTDKAANRSDRGSERVEAINGTLVGVLIASIEPHEKDVSRPVLTKAGWFFLCGEYAYKSLPFNWSGVCTLGTIRPALEVLYLRKRQKREATNPLVTRSSGWWSFMRAFSPSFGVMELEAALVNISVAMERFANYTSHGMSAIQKEIASISAFSYQTRLGIDFLLAKSGGLCRTLNITCCFLIDKSGEISTDIAQIRKQAALFHEIGLDNAINLGDFAHWMKGVFGEGWSGWFMRIILTIIVICLMALICKRCMIIFLDKLCSSAEPKVHLYPLEDPDTEQEFNRLASINEDDEVHGSMPSLVFP